MSYVQLVKIMKAYRDNHRTLQHEPPKEVRAAYYDGVKAGLGLSNDFLKEAQDEQRSNS